MRSDFMKIIADDLYANGYRAWGMYEDFIYPKIKEEIEKRYDCKLSDSDYDEVVDKLALLYFEQFIAVDKIGDSNYVDKIGDSNYVDKIGDLQIT